MLAKLTAKNQITLPKSVTQAIGPVEYEQQGPVGKNTAAHPGRHHSRPGNRDWRLSHCR